MTGSEWIPQKRDTMRAEASGVNALECRHSPSCSTGSPCLLVDRSRSASEIAEVT